MSNKLAKNPRECFIELITEEYMKELIDEHNKIIESDDIGEVKASYEMLYQDIINLKVQIYCLENNKSYDFYEQMEEEEYKWSFPNREKEKKELYGDCYACGKDCAACDKSVIIDGKKYPPAIAKKIKDNEKRMIEIQKQINENKKILANR